MEDIGISSDQNQPIAIPETYFKHHSHHHHLMEATNVSILDLGDLCEPLERLSTSCAPPLALADLPSPHSTNSDVKEKRPSWKKVLDVKMRKPEAKGTVVAQNKDPVVESLTVPVESLSLGNHHRQPSPTNSRDSNDSLTSSALEEASSAALAVSSFLDQNGRPVKKRGRFQRRNSFVIHRDRAQSLVSNHGSNAHADADHGEKSKFDMSGARSQSLGTLGLAPRESNLVFQRMSLPWKRKTREAEP